MSRSINISSSIDNLTADINDLIVKNNDMISEIDAIIQGLYDIHQEINQVELAVVPQSIPLYFCCR